ncbi:hypothetical protein D3870_00295 [Noviherbaspirillum cavernae]|uniref:Polysaccharide deacetylase n=1 Tax=Noviherbaspirillum cavernae TaxID=2320862 RepID=A0A418WWP5_9BURK|nr:hypothetical protein [Noviherbaspirillum cavernae]RJG04666.1 hypothetical protein D3870_00295 [Noviherbaspirillum cavernae]
MRDFTLAAYMRVIRALQDKGLPIFGIQRWLTANPSNGALIRHDVDRRPLNALRMAEAEARAGIQTTYYFRVVGSAFDTKIMREVSQLGHEVGYHYEDLALVRGNMQAALASFKKHLAMLREIVPIQTAAMHGSPLSRHNNLEIWGSAAIEEYQLIGEAFLSVNYQNVYYFTDTGRSWGATSTNLRDRPVGILTPEFAIHDSRELCAFIMGNPIEKLAISAHPERWDSSLAGWAGQALKDGAVNAVKRVIANARR